MTPAEMYRSDQARQRVNALKTGVPLKRYVDGMARRHEILPGSETVIIEAVMKPPDLNAPRSTLAHLGVPAPERPAPLPGGNSHGDLIARCVAYLEGPGKGYLNPRHIPDTFELPLVAIVRRLGMNKSDAEQFYRDHAVALAGRAGGSLAAGVFHALASSECGARYLGVEPPNANPAPEPTAAPSPQPAAQPAPAAGLMVGGNYYHLPAAPAPEAKAEPVGPAERHMAGIKGGF